MAAADQQRLNRRSAAHEHGADALGPVHLVRADREQVAAEAAHIERDLARALHGVDMEEDAGVGGDLADLFDRLQNAGLVVGQHDADQPGLGPDGAQNVVGSIRPLGCGATNVVSTPCWASRSAACRIAECSIDVVMKWSPGCSRPKIAVLSPSVPPELKTTSASWQLKNSRHRLAGAVDGRAGLLPMQMDRRGVAKVLHPIRAHGLHHLWQQRRGGIGVHIDSDGGN